MCGKRFQYVRNCLDVLETAGNNLRVVGNGLNVGGMA